MRLPLFRKLRAIEPKPASRSCVEPTPKLLRSPWEIEYDPKSSEDDIYYCFRLLLGRNPSFVEWNGHKALAGRDLANTVASYLSCREFKNRKLNTLSDADHVLVDLGTHKIFVSPADTVVGRHIYETKTYEPNVTAAITKATASGMCFVDVGANIGYFTMLASRLVGKGGKVIAFEPFQYNVKLLYLSARANGFDNIEIYPFAVADRQGLIAYDNMASNGVISEIENSLNSVLSTTLVYSVSLDGILQHLDRLDVLKIDVEGAEYMVLKGAHDLLKRFRPIIFSEFSPPFLQALSQVTAETYLQLLLVDSGYSISVLGSNGDTINCGRDLGKVVEYFNNSGSDHIDVAAYPA